MILTLVRLHFLGFPFSILQNYCNRPEIKPEDNDVLQEVLVKNLPKLCDKIKIPWRELKDVKKSERKKFKEEYAKNNQLVVNRSDSKGVIIGVNNVTKLLEKNGLSVVIISNDVQPKLMVQHIIDLCVLYCIPVVVFRGLRNVLKDVCGIASTVLGISKEIDLKSGRNLIREIVTQIFEKCPKPVNHINYNRFLENEGILVSQIQECVPSVENKIDEEEIRQSIYLKRDSKTTRIFVPEYSEKPSRNDKMEVDSEGFLAFSQQPSQNNTVNVKSYKSLVIKKLRGDPNRNKRKIANLKKKSQ